jgi:hypothetical protein
MPASPVVAVPSATEGIPPGHGESTERVSRSVEPGSSARELAAEVSRLLRIRRGELAEPPAWALSERRRRIASFIDQLSPIRSRAALQSSFGREASADADVRLAYAVTWLELGRRLQPITTRRRRARAVISRLSSRS